MEQPALVVTETEDVAKKDQTPLWQLAEAGDLDRVKIALNNGAQVVRFFFKSLFFFLNFKSNTFTFSNLSFEGERSRSWWKHASYARGKLNETKRLQMQRQEKKSYTLK